MYSSFKDIWGADLADMQLQVNSIKKIGFYCVVRY